MILYHFTDEQHLPYILEDQALRLTESNIGSPSTKVQPSGEGRSSSKAGCRESRRRSSVAAFWS